MASGRRGPRGRTIPSKMRGFLVVRFAGGQWVTLCITQIDSHPKDAVLEITGTRGSYLFNQKQWELVRQKGGKAVVTRGVNPPNEWWRFYRNIAEHLVNRKKLIITGEWARRPIYILDLGNRSAAKGKAIKAKYG